TPIGLSYGRPASFSFASASGSQRRPTISGTTGPVGRRTRYTTAPTTIRTSTAAIAMAHHGNFSRRGGAATAQGTMSTATLGPTVESLSGSSSAVARTRKTNVPGASPAGTLMLTRSVAFPLASKSRSISRALVAGAPSKVNQAGFAEPSG